MKSGSSIKTPKERRQDQENTQIKTKNIERERERLLYSCAYGKETVRLYLEKLGRR